MANEEHLALLRKGVAGWNTWRSEHPDIRPDLSQAQLRGTDLQKVNLAGASLEAADLRGTDFRDADLGNADLRRANLFKVVLDRANLIGADLAGAQFLNCAQLVTAHGWQRAFRDEDLACGAGIPERPGGG